MTQRAPFKPHYGQTQTVSPAAATANITIGKGDKTLKVINSGANIVFFRTGNSVTTVGGQANIVTTAADCPIVANTMCYIEKPQDDDTFAFISALGSTLVICPGEGGV